MKVVYRIVVTLILVALCGCTFLSGVPETAQILELQQKAYDGDLESQYQLGLQYTLKGKWYGDYNRGYKWFLSAAEREHTQAQYMAGMGKLLGRGTGSDQEGAIMFLTKAADKGHARAQYQVGNAYLNGTGVEKDQAWGRHWLEQAAWQDHRYAQFLLAALFSGGVGGKQNNAEAWRWARKASRNGLERADQALNNLEDKITAQELANGKALLQSQSPLEGKLYRVPQIRYIQTVLNQRGYDAGPEDGKEGLRTLSAVADYIQDNNLPRKNQISDLIEFLRRQR